MKSIDGSITFAIQDFMVVKIYSSSFLYFTKVRKPQDAGEGIDHQRDTYS